MSEAELENRAKDGDIEAQCSLGFLYEIGLDRPQDYEKAASYWHMAAAAGSQLALDKLHQLVKDQKIAASWLTDFEQLGFGKKDEQNSSPSISLGAKIILAEDEDDLRELITETLQAAGYRVVGAADGEEALQKLMANGDTSLIISDLKMPKMNGLQFLRTVRKLQIEIPLVIMTAYSQQKVIDEGLKLGIQAWIVKPVRRDMLLETVQRVLEKKSVA